MLRLLAICLLTVSPLLMWDTAGVAAEPYKGTLAVGKRVLVADYSKKTLAIVGADGKTEWQQPIRDIHDAWLLPNGNVLFQTDWRTVVEKNPAGETVWSYEADKKNGNEGKLVEVHAFQRLDNGDTMIAESGPARIIEVNKDGQIQKSIPLTVRQRDVHRDTRLARKLKSGNYLVCHEKDEAVREYDQTGKVVWEYPVGSAVYSAERLENGNTLVGTGNGHKVVEVDPQGKTVWSLEQSDLKGIQLAWITMVERLPNGNTLVVNCHAGPDNPQLLEVTPEKQVVWTFRDFERFGNNTPVGKALPAKE